MQLNDRLSPHFMAYELADRVGAEHILPDDPAILAKVVQLVTTGLEPFRVDWERYLIDNVLGGSPRVTVICGIRSPAHNAEVGGAQASRHMTGEASDICCDVDWAALRRGVGTRRDADRMETFASFLEKWIDKHDVFGGFGIYRTPPDGGQLYWCHVDIRQRVNGHVARWFGGLKGTGSEQ